MEPLPEVRAAAAQLFALTGTDPLDDLISLGALAIAVVPSCVGVSLTVVVDGEPFTVTSTAVQGRALDAVQYLAGGPCLDTALNREETSVPDVLDERRWQTYGRAATGLGIRSSLSLPIGGDGAQTPGAINLYASDPHAFRDTAVVLAVALHVPANHLVTNADLSFMTRELAQQLPARLDTKFALDTAVGVLMEVHDWSPDDARRRLQEAAVRAGTPVKELADLVLALYSG